MEIIQGKSSDKRIVVAQEIAFAKVLSGNNKTLRDRALKKLKKWLTIRGNGKWAFTEDEFIRLWTGLFYCMWMSDKFLVQEELAESISQLIHCFKKNSDNAILFVKCFNKRILMEWEGLDQYRIDKFNMLIRRFLRQTFEYCKGKDWERSILLKIADIFYDVVLHRDNSLGFVIHFINIYAEELAKVGKGKLESSTVLVLIEPFVKLISTTNEPRIMAEAENFFMYLMRQTDVGIEFEEKFNEWKKLGYPGTNPNCLQRVKVKNGSVYSDDEEDEEEDEEMESGPMDPRAGSVHVYLPQISFNTNAVIKLFKKYEKSKSTTFKGRKKLRNLALKFGTLNRGKFPENIKKDPILDENTKKRHQTKQNAKRLLEFMENLDKKSIATQDLRSLEKELEEQSSEEELDNDLSEDVNDSEEEELDNDINDINDSDDVEEDDNENENSLEDESYDNHKKNSKTVISAKVKNNKLNKTVEKVSKNAVKDKLKPNKKIKQLNGIGSNTKENSNFVQEKGKNKKNLKKKENKETKNQLKKEKNCEVNNKQKAEIKPVENKVSPKVKTEEEETLKPTKKRPSLVSLNSENVEKPTPTKKRKSEEVKIKSVKKRESLNGSISNEEKVTPKKNSEVKRKILSNWQVQELDTNSPEYFTIKTPNIIRIERKLEDSLFLEENETPKDEGKTENKSPEKVEKKENQETVPAFWKKAVAKVNTKKSRKSDVFVNPFGKSNEDGKSPGLRRISFALDKNMAQENAEYLEEVKNSPKVPFDGSRKPIQSALKSGLSPSPINPFYRFKKIKLA